MLGTVDAVEPGRMVARLDGAARSEEMDARAISVSMNDCNAIDHGYATTIHKNQDATVDRSIVLASGTMDRHLTYVATTRHRDSAQPYAGMEEFTDRRADQSLAPERIEDPRSGVALARGSSQKVGEDLRSENRRMISLGMAATIGRSGSAGIRSQD